MKHFSHRHPLEYLMSTAASGPIIHVESLDGVLIVFLPGPASCPKNSKNFSKFSFNGENSCCDFMGTWFSLGSCLARRVAPSWIQPLLRVITRAWREWFVGIFCSVSCDTFAFTGTRGWGGVSGWGWGNLNCLHRCLFRFHYQLIIYR